jgi:hypothetical protein
MNQLEQNTETLDAQKLDEEIFATLVLLSPEKKRLFMAFGAELMLAQEQASVACSPHSDP